MTSSWNTLRRSLALHRLLPIRHRYFLNENNVPRLRYVCAFGASKVALLAAFAVVSSFSSFSSLSPGTTQSAAFEVASLEPQSGAPDAAQKVLASHDAARETLQDHVSGGIRKASASIRKAAANRPATADVKVGRGETLASVLTEAGVSGDDAYGAVKALSRYVDPRSIRAGQVVNIQFAPGGTEPEFARLSMEMGPLKQITVRKEAEQFVGNVVEKELKPRTYAGFAKIKNSLYGSAEQAGIPAPALAEVMRLYSRIIDFQRDIQPGDSIKVLYEGKETEDGEFVKFGTLVYAEMTVGGRAIPLYRFKGPDGREDFYDEQGRTTRKTLLKTPIDGARMSSGFGMRRHPILGYSKMHKGVDFAAPTGTPIYAAGDGTIDFVGRKNGYGNYIAIRHNSGLKTAYAHLSRFNARTKRGARVRQGDVIGYVGSTGRSTGPHLHYEVIMNGAQVNPKRVDLPTGENLKGRDLAKFKRVIGGIEQQYASLSQNMKLAQLQQTERDENRGVN